MDGLVEETLDRIASETAFSGAVRVDDGDVVLEKAYGYAHRGLRIANTVGTQFALASGSKGLTALAVMSLIEDGTLELTTTARSVLGPDLPLIDDGVTVEHLLAHRSGIGDYLDEDDDRPITDYVMTISVHELATTEGFLAVLDGHPTKFEPDARFSYCNGGFMVLALIAERSSGIPFHDLVRQRVCEPAGMHDTEYLRSDEPSRAALGYLSLDSDRTNVFHIPVRGNGDGGVYSTLADIHSLWSSLFEGRIVSPASVAEMVRPRSDVPSESKRYGLGFWLLASGSAVNLEGYDAGASFHSVHDPESRITRTVVSNTSEGAWPLARYLNELFLGSAP
ncbi:MAG: beta-lactamase family protein [Actinomycetota bacterium]|nr:beta-lactamase family protein [Actinomycetota bacterium]